LSHLSGGKCGFVLVPTADGRIVWLNVPVEGQIDYINAAFVPVSGILSNATEHLFNIFDVD